MTSESNVGDQSHRAQSLLNDVPIERRAFLRKAAVGSAVAAPLIASFSMSGMGAAYAQTPGVSGSTTTTSTTTSTTTTSTTTTTTIAPNQIELCGPNGPYGWSVYSYGPNQSPATVRPDLFGPNGVCENFSFDWWSFPP
jgi:hypothetical protein